jgi:hypothetical protein
MACTTAAIITSRPDPVGIQDSPARRNRCVGWSEGVVVSRHSSAPLSCLSHTGWLIFDPTCMDAS